jgi:hypothetical protein
MACYPYLSGLLKAHVDNLGETTFGVLATVGCFTTSHGFILVPSGSMLGFPLLASYVP